MLDTLRRKSRSTFTIVIFALIIISFIAYFGLSRNGADISNGGGVAATVDGSVIDQMTLNRYVAFIKEQQGREIPDNFLPYFEKSILQSLVQKEIIKKQAYDIGLFVSDEELASFIKKNASFADEKGNFDSQKYAGIRQYINGRFGLDFEKMLRDDLLVQKFEDLFRQSVVVTEKYKNINSEIEKKTVPLERVIIRPSRLSKDFKADEKEIAKLLEEKKNANTEETFDEEKAKKEIERDLKKKFTEEKALALSKTVWPAFKTGKMTEKELEKQGLSLEALGPVSLNDASTLIPGKPDLAFLTSLFSLSEKNLAPDEPYLSNGQYYLFRWTKNVKKDEKKVINNNSDIVIDGEEEKVAPEQAFADLFYRKWSETQAKKSDIQIYKK